MYKKLAVLFALAAVPVMVFASPAAALAQQGEIRHSEEVTYTWDDGPYTCDLLGVLIWSYDAGQDVTQIRAFNQGNSQTDSECSSPSVAIRNQITITWTTEEQERPQSSQSQARAADSGINVTVAGEVTSLKSLHFWSYNCTESTHADDACYHSFEIKAK